MKLICILPLFFLFQDVNGQFAVIKDSDGFAYVRSTPDIKGEIKSKVYNGEIIYCYLPEESKNNWYLIDFGKWIEANWYLVEFGKSIEIKDSIKQSGYLHRSRLKYLSEFEHIPIRERSTNTMIFQKDSIKISISKVPFIAKNNKLQYEQQGHFLKKINGKEIWGRDGGIPNYQYSEILIQIGEKRVNLPKMSYMDLYEPNLKPDYTHVSFDKESNRLYIYASNSDAAGSYDIVWVIENGKYLERQLSNAYA